MARLLKNWLNTYLEFTSLTESPEIFHFWAGVSTIAGALRRRVWIDMGEFEYTPNFYIIFVAPAGIATKSSTINTGMRLLREIETVSFGPDSATWQAIGRALMEAKELVPLEPGNLEGDFEEMSCITCCPGELGTFLDFQDRKMIDVLTSLWDGQRGTFEHRTSTQGTILITNPWINLISATTPAWLKRNVPEEAIGGGLASRIIFAFANKKRQLIAYPGHVGDRKHRDKLRKDLVHDLRNISEMFGEFVIDGDALEWGDSWYKEVWTNRPAHMASERFDGYIARKQTHVHKLAIIMSSAESSSRVITQAHLSGAAEIVSSMEEAMINVFESIGIAPMSRLLSEIINYLHTMTKAGMVVTQQMYFRHCWQIMSVKEQEEVTMAATKAGYIEIRQVGETIQYILKVKPEDIGRNPGRKEE